MNCHASRLSKPFSRFPVLVSWRTKNVQNRSTNIAGSNPVRHVTGRMPEIACFHGDLFPTLDEDTLSFEQDAPLLLRVAMYLAGTVWRYSHY